MNFNIQLAIVLSVPVSLTGFNYETKSLRSHQLCITKYLLSTYHVQSISALKKNICKDYAHLKGPMLHTHTHARCQLHYVYAVKSTAPVRTSVHIHLEASEMLIVKHRGAGAGASAEPMEARGTFHCTLVLHGPLQWSEEQAGHEPRYPSMVST